MRTVKVRVSFEVYVQVDADTDIAFVIEENGCPGTGPVGEAVQFMANREDGICLICAANGENKIISVDGVPWK